MQDSILTAGDRFTSELAAVGFVIPFGTRAPPIEDQ
jgi:hypothetical protein